MSTGTKKAKAVAAADQQKVLGIPPMNIAMITIKVIGDSPLITHRWSEKAKQMMLDKQQKKGQQVKPAKDPEQDYQESMYHLPGGKYGFPATGFKSAMVSSCRFADGIAMTQVRGAVHVIGEMVEIEGDGPEMCEEMVRIAMGTADIRYRAKFKNWHANLTIRYNANAISPEQIANLINLSGFGVGVGEWRPETNGSYGMYHVAQNGE